MDSVKISVIVPTFKPSGYLWTCLDSIVNQTFSRRDYEVIIVLNGCSNPWKSEIENYILTKMQGMLVHFIHTETCGVSNARNLGLDAAKGDYITFIDDDDYVSPSYLSELFSKSTEHIISVCYPLSFKDGTEIYEPYRITKDYIKNVNKGKCHFNAAKRFFSGPVYKLINRNIIGERRFDKRFSNGEDSLFMFLISDRFNYVDFTSTAAVYYRRLRYNSATTSNRNRLAVVENEIKRIWQYSCIYFRAPLSYNFSFYLTRVLGAFKSMVL